MRVEVVWASRGGSDRHSVIRGGDSIGLSRCSPLLATFPNDRYRSCSSKVWLYAQIGAGAVCVAQCSPAEPEPSRRLLLVRRLSPSLRLLWTRSARLVLHMEAGLPTSPTFVVTADGFVLLDAFGFVLPVRGVGLLPAEFGQCSVHSVDRPPQLRRARVRSSLDRPLCRFDDGPLCRFITTNLHSYHHADGSTVQLRQSLYAYFTPASDR
jgi:hypothetical protein